MYTLKIIIVTVLLATYFISCDRSSTGPYDINPIVLMKMNTTNNTIKDSVLFNIVIIDRVNKTFPQVLYKGTIDRNGFDSAITLDVSIAPFYHFHCYVTDCDSGDTIYKGNSSFATLLDTLVIKLDVVPDSLKITGNPSSNFDTVGILRSIYYSPDNISRFVNIDTITTLDTHLISLHYGIDSLQIIPKISGTKTCTLKIYDLFRRVIKQPIYLNIADSNRTPVIQFDTTYNKINPTRYNPIDTFVVNNNDSISFLVFDPDTTDSITLVIDSISILKRIRTEKYKLFWAPGIQYLDTVHEIKVFADDNRGKFDSLSLHLFVRPNTAPEFREVPTSNTFITNIKDTITFKVIDNDSDSFTITLDSLAIVNGFKCSKDIVWWKPPENFANRSIDVILAATDLYNMKSTHKITCIVHQNNAPQIDSFPIPDTVIANVIYTIPIVAHDNEGSIVSFDVSQSNKTDGMNIEADTFTWRPYVTLPGKIDTIQITAFDVHNNSAFFKYPVFIWPNTAPKITSFPIPDTVIANVEYTILIVAHDNEGNIVSFDLSQSNKIDGMNIEADIFTWQPSVTLSGKIDTINITAFDEHNQSILYQYPVFIRANTAPEFTEVSNSNTFITDKEDTITFKVIDKESDQFTISLDSLSIAHGFKYSEHNLWWKPSKNFAGKSVDVIITAADRFNMKSSHMITCIVHQNSAPQIDSFPVPDTVIAHVLYAIPITAYDNEGSTVLFDLSQSNKTDGMNIEADTFTWRPFVTLLGKIDTIEITTFDEHNYSLLFKYPVFIRPNTAPKFVKIPTIDTFITDIEDTIAFKVIDNESDPFTMSIDSLSIAKLFKYSENKLWWKPSKVFASNSIDAILTATDRYNMKSTHTITCIVHPNNTPKIDSFPIPDTVIAHVPYTIPISAHDPEGSLVSLDLSLKNIENGMRIIEGTFIWQPHDSLSGRINIIQITALDAHDYDSLFSYPVFVRKNEAPKIFITDNPNTISFYDDSFEYISLQIINPDRDPFTLSTDPINHTKTFDRNITEENAEINYEFQIDNEDKWESAEMNTMNYFKIIAVDTFGLADTVRDSVFIYDNF